MSNEPVLVVGGTGFLGGQVVDALQQRGRNVRALVRPTSDASKLETKGVEVVRGDMLDRRSLVAAMDGVDAVVSTAAGYTRRNKNATENDTVGQANLAEAASDAGVRRFVLTSILTCDLTPHVSHFWHKKLAEDALERYEVPFVALRPGAFLDMVTQMGGDPFAKKRLMWFGTTTAPLTFVLTSDVARCPSPKPSTPTCRTANASRSAGRGLCACARSRRSPRGSSARRSRCAACPLWS